MHRTISILERLDDLCYFMYLYVWNLAIPLPSLQIPLRKGEGHAHWDQVQEQIAAGHEEVRPKRLQFHPRARISVEANICSK